MFFFMFFFILLCHKYCASLKELNTEVALLKGAFLSKVGVRQIVVMV